MELLDFLTSLDNEEWGIKLEKKWSRERISFLDLEIYVKDGALETKTYFKDVDTNTYIDKTSCHNTIWLKGIPKGQFTRLCRNCSDDMVFEEQVGILKQEFIDKGYDKVELEGLIRDLKMVDQKNLIQYKTRKEATKGVPFLCDFNVNSVLIKKVFRKHWHFLKKDKDLDSIITSLYHSVFRLFRRQIYLRYSL